MSDRRISDQYYVLGGEDMNNELKYLKERLRIKESNRLNLQLDLNRCSSRLKARELKIKIQDLDNEISGLKREIEAIENQMKGAQNECKN